MKIMLDTNIYDALYDDEEVQLQLVELLRTSCINIGSTPIQIAELEAMSAPEKVAKKEWCLQFLTRYANIKPSLFSFDVDGTGFDQGRMATPEEYITYNKIKPNSNKKNHHPDRNIAVIANSESAIFVGSDNKLRSGLKTVLPNLRVLNWSEFTRYIKIESTRLKYRPKDITTLFVGESAPASGDFFYYCKSDLYRCMKSAMEAAGLGGNGDFLDHFKTLGWYLDDLVLTPVNKGFSDSERKEACRIAQPCLAKRIAKYEPLAIVSLLLAERVKKFVYAAAADACNGVDCYAVHFPGLGNQRRFLSDMEDIILKLPRRPLTR